MADKRQTVCMISCCHLLLDDRIYQKEALTLAQNGYDVVHIGYGDTADDYYTKDHIRIVRLEKKRKSGGLQSRIEAFKQLKLNDLFEAAKAVSAGVYHLHDVELCRIALKLKQLPHHPAVIYDAHEPFPDNLKDYWGKRSPAKVLFNDIPALWYERKVLSGMDYLIATEENVAKRFRAKNPNTAIIYNYSWFHPDDPDDTEKTFDIVYCGLLSQSKGIYEMLNALWNCQKRGYHFKFLLVGNFADPVLEMQVKQVIQEKGLGEQVVFAGAVDYADVVRFYRMSKAAFCLFPSNRTNRLILPIKLFEYAAFGLPVIGSDFGHIQDIIRSNGLGICVNPQSAIAVADALIELLTCDKYKEFIPVAKQCVRDKYLWDNQKDKLLGIYEQVLKS